MLSLGTILKTFLSQAIHGLYRGLISLPLAALIYAVPWALILHKLGPLVRRVARITPNRAVQDFILNHQTTWRFFAKYALVDSPIGTLLEPLAAPLRTEPDATEVTVFFQVVVLLWVVEGREFLARLIDDVLAMQLFILGYLRMWGYLKTPPCIDPRDGSKPEYFTLNANGLVAIEDEIIRALIISTNIMNHVIAEAREVLMASLSWAVYVRWPEQLWTWAVRMLGQNFPRPEDTSFLGRASMPLLSLAFAILRTFLIGDDELDFPSTLFCAFAMLFESHFNPIFAP